MTPNIFIINPGSTSTKVAIFEGSTCKFERAIHHVPDELRAFSSAVNQFEYRLAVVKRIIMEEYADPGIIDAIAGRGGLLKPVKGGAYLVGEAMLDDLKNARYGDHASNLGAIIAARLADEYGKNAYVVNPPVVDELIDVARFTGLPEIKRVSVFHALNQKAAAIRAAADAGLEYNKGRFIVAHLGGGITVGAHDKGRVIDVNNALEEGPFTPERAGSLPSRQLVELCFSGHYSKEEIRKMLVGKGGLFAFTGTTNCEDLLIKSDNDNNIKMLLDAMIYRISREICASAAALYGKIDRIVITGGLAYSSYIINGIRERVSFLGPLLILPGENEMAALADGVLRVLEGNEEALEYEG